jgi:ATP phosphoribosyltransferase
MHVAWSALFRPAPRRPRPSVRALRALIAGRLALAPRFRQRLAWPPPGFGEPFWVDDPEFDVAAHVIELTEPDEPVSLASFAALTDALLSEPLDRRRPLWRFYFVPRLEDGRLGLVGKMHHALVDGVSAVELGITGKDVLLEQPEREVYELVDLGYGRCRMVVAAREGDDALGESLRRLGRVRIATKYPRLAARHFAETGRQAEIVEVKGSVELAPLTGLVDGIVDLTASGHTLAENRLEVVEEVAVSTARLIANPVAHKLKAEQIDGLVERVRGAVP